MTTADADYAVLLIARFPRIAWAVQAIGSARERSWRVVERGMDQRLAAHPQLTQVGPRLRAIRPVSWLWLEMELTQMVAGPYIAELAEFES